MQTKHKRTIEVTTYTLANEIEDMCWKKTGFKDADAIRDKVRSLSLEERVNMLTEIFIDELATRHLEDKYRFIEGLGGSPAVTEQELKDYVAATYIDDDEVEWRIDVRGDHYIHPERFCSHEYRDYQRKALRKKNWKHKFLTDTRR
jgi:hypothetical protein